MTTDNRRLAVPSPIGTLVIEASDDALVSLRLPAPGNGRGVPTLDAIDGNGHRNPLGDAAAQLEEYFAGRRRRFDLPFVLSGTPFQCDVWRSLADIPYGTTVSYAELAEMVGRPTAFRAVGQANGSNPLPIVLPCHRVVASGGGIGGYGGGLPVKRKLLSLEGAAGNW